MLRVELFECVALNALGADFSVTLQGDGARVELVNGVNPRRFHIGRLYRVTVEEYCPKDPALAEADTAIIPMPAKAAA